MLVIQYIMSEFNQNVWNNNYETIYCKLSLPTTKACSYQNTRVVCTLGSLETMEEM